MGSNQITRIFGLDLIRAIAISLVVVSHISLLIFPNSENVLLTIVRVFGAIGVDLFFVLSGYLIGGILLKQINAQKTTLKDLIFFWKRRWFRTLPNYFLVLGFNVLVFVILGKSLPDNTWLYVPFLQNFLNAHPNFFTEAWSLSVEEYAYLILPFILFMSFYLFKKNQKEKLFIRATLIIILALFLLKLNYFFNTEINSYKEWSSTFRKVVVYRIDSIYWGFVLVYLIKKYPINIKKFKNYFLIIGLFLLVGIHVVILKMNLLPSTNLGFYVFVYLQVVILSLGFVFPFCININYTGFFVKTTQFISVHSYSIYLVNYSIILLTIQNNLNIESMTIFQKGMMVFIFLTLTIFSSMIIYRYFELPILRYRDSKFKRIVK